MTTPETTPLVLQRPTSPHLQIYRWQITMVMSILHRATGLALVAGTLLLVCWISAAAYSPHCFNLLHEFFGGLIGKIMLFCWSVAFYYHLLNGIRHLWWDMGRGFELQDAERSGWMVVVGCFLLTVITWIIAFSASGAVS